MKDAPICRPSASSGWSNAERATGYLLALAAGLAATSYLARGYGTMRVYGAALAGFLIASAACAAAPSIAALIAGRASQGLLGAPPVPLAMSVLLGRQGAARRIPVAAGLLLAGLAGGVALLAAYTVWGLRARHPAVDLTLLRHGRSALALGLSVTSSVVAFAAVFLLPVFTQTVQHHSAFVTGLALLPQGLITGVGTALGQRLGQRIDVRALVCGGFIVLAVASAGLLLLTPTTPLWATAAPARCGSGPLPDSTRSAPS
jgi:MFS family permease